MAAEKQTVFLSGVSGFIAQHVAQQLLETGKFKVIGSVRTKEKAAVLKNNFKDINLSFVYVEDISKPDAFNEAFEKYGSEIDYVIHTASPFHFNTTNVEKDLIIPAQIGSSGIFEAAAKYAPNLKHFVVTSSHAATVDVKRNGDHAYKINEESWNPMEFEEAIQNPLFGYCYSKKVGEKVVWELAKTLNVKFNVTSVNPVFVFGPQTFDSSVTEELNTSCEIINKFIHSPVNFNVDEGSKGYFIDVRDVARAHIAPILASEKFKGQRLILSAGPFGDQSIVDVLNEIPQLKGKIPVGHPRRNEIIGDDISGVDNSKTKKLLEFNFISLEHTVKDTALQILKTEGKL